MNPLILAYFEIFIHRLLHDYVFGKLHIVVHHPEGISGYYRIHIHVHFVIKCRGIAKLDKMQPAP